MGFQDLLLPLACSEHAQQALLNQRFMDSLPQTYKSLPQLAQQTGYANHVTPNFHRVGPCKRTPASPDPVAVQIIYLPLSKVTPSFLKLQFLISPFKIAFHYDRALKYCTFPKCLVYTHCLKPWSLSWPICLLSSRAALAPCIELHPLGLQTN